MVNAQHTLEPAHITTPTGTRIDTGTRAHPRTHLSVRAAADALAVSTKIMQALTDAMIFQREYRDLIALGSANVLVPTTNTIPVVRLGTPGVDHDGRPVGFDPAYQDNTLCNASRMWWHCDPERWLAAKIALVTHGKIVVAVLGITGLADSIEVERDNGRTGVRYAFDAHLIGRFTSLHTPPRLTGNGTPDEDTFTRTVLGCWSEAISGGPVAYL